MGEALNIAATEAQPGWLAAKAEALATGRFGVDPERRGYCYAWKIEYRREKNGRVTRCQGSERTYANRADAEMVADFARRHADPELDRLFGPETITVHLVSTSVCGLTHDVPERFSA